MVWECVRMEAGNTALSVFSVAAKVREGYQRMRSFTARGGGARAGVRLRMELAIMCNSRVIDLPSVLSYPRLYRKVIPNWEGIDLCRESNRRSFPCSGQAPIFWN